MGVSPLDLLNVTLNSLRRNPLRSGLSMLGVFMGVSAVTATLQVGTISRASIEAELAKQEAPQVTVFPRWEPNKPYEPFEVDDLIYLSSRLVDYEAISGFAWAGTPEAQFYERQANPLMRAVTLQFPTTSGRKLLAGRFFTASDFDQFRSVVVIDEYLAQNLFEGGVEQAIRQRIYLDRRAYVVMGVMETKLEDEEPPEGEVYIPLTLHQAMTGQAEINWMRIRPGQLAEIDQIDQETQALLQQRFPERRFSSWHNVEGIKERQEVLNLASRGLAAVGVISLLVGGVGIANIMIASVAERTAEIGLRRAIGATQTDIMLQFVLEATIISVTGGAIALLTVHSVTELVANRFDLPYEFEAKTGLIAMGAAVAVGLGSSLFPAIQASQLDPVQALRSG